MIIVEQVTSLVATKSAPTSRYFFWRDSCGNLRCGSDPVGPFDFQKLGHIMWVKQCHLHHSLQSSCSHHHFYSWYKLTIPSHGWCQWHCFSHITSNKPASVCATKGGWRPPWWSAVVPFVQVWLAHGRDLSPPCGCAQQGMWHMWSMKRVRDWWRWLSLKMGYTTKLPF